MTLQEYSKAPDFELPDENGELHKLSQYEGKTVILYFYPKDDTKGCTTEACNFRDDYNIYEKEGVVILGVSPDSSQSHTKFAKKYELPFTLLADEERKVCKLYDVWGLKKFMGKEYEGVFRTTYLIDEKGIIKKVYKNVKPTDHSAEILSDIKK